MTRSLTKKQEAYEAAAPVVQAIEKSAVARCDHRHQ
jgi:hypothetical protein